MSAPPSKTLEATIEIAAPPAQVWAAVSDLTKMGERSPQCKKMFVLGGPVGVGTRTVNINADGWKVWPTTSKVVAFEPDRRLAFRIAENNTVWSFTLEPTATGTRLTQRREAPNGTSAVSRFLVDKVFGGSNRFDDSLVVGMNSTLGQIKNEVERSTRV